MTQRLSHTIKKYIPENDSQCMGSKYLWICTYNFLIWLLYRFEILSKSLKVSRKSKLQIYPNALLFLTCFCCAFVVQLMDRKDIVQWFNYTSQSSTTTQITVVHHLQKLHCYTGGPLIGRFLGPRKTRLNRNPSY